VPRKYVFVDEAGNFDFSLGGSAYFILTSVVTDDCVIGDELLALRRELVWNGEQLTDAFHANEDKRSVKNEVFRLLGRHTFRIDATIFEKRKVAPNQQNHDAFYEYAWYRHLKFLAPRVATANDDLMVVGASIATERRQRLIGTALNGVVNRTARAATIRFTHWPAASDPCLQVVDYCCWAIQRKWERGDGSFHALIANKIASEFNAFGRQNIYYY
jgi:hypothetical protein